MNDGEVLQKLRSQGPRSAGPGQPDEQLFLYTAKKGSPSADALKILGSWQSEDPVATGALTESD